MVFSYSCAFGYASVAFIVYQIIKLFSTRRHIAREAQRRGCLPPPIARNRGFWGINTLRESVAATKAEWGPQWMHAAINEIGKDVHTVRACVFDYELLITRDIDNIKAIFNTKSADFDIGPHREKTFKSAFGLGVMTARGEAWQHSRRLIRPQFTRDNTANLPMFEKHVQSLFKKLRPTQDLWTSKVDLQPLFSYCTLDISTEFLVSGQYILPETPSDFH